MWQVRGKPVQGDWLDLEPVTVLYDFDGPTIFTCQDVYGKLYLMYQCGEEPGRMRFLVVPFSEASVTRLTTGDMSLHDALMRPRAWLFDVDYQGHLLAAHETVVENLPPATIPAPGVMLWSHLKPTVVTNQPRSASASETLLVGPSQAIMQAFKPLVAS